MKKVVILCGTTCAGKSTLSKTLSNKGFIHIDGDLTIQELAFEKAGKSCSEEYDLCYRYLSSDELDKLFNYGKSQIPKKFSLTKNEQDQLIFAQKVLIDAVNDLLPTINSSLIMKKIYDKASPYLGSNDIVVDTFLLNNEIMDSVRKLITGNYIKFILCYCPLKTLRERWIKRNIEAMKNETSNFRSPIFILNDLFLLYDFVKNTTKLSVEMISENSWKNLVAKAYYEHNKVKEYVTRFNRKLIHIISPSHNENNPNWSEYEWEESKTEVTDEVISALSDKVKDFAYLVPKANFDQLVDTSKSADVLSI